MLESGTFFKLTSLIFLLFNCETSSNNFVIIVLSCVVVVSHHSHPMHDSSSAAALPHLSPVEDSALLLVEEGMLFLVFESLKAEGFGRGFGLIKFVLLGGIARAVDSFPMQENQATVLAPMLYVIIVFIT